MNRDIVYFVKDTEENEELRYSLRSVEENVKNYNKVWFFGGKPKGIEPDRYVHTRQNSSKHANVRYMVRQAIMNEEVSDEFWLFNDDFFIMKPLTDEQFISGTLWKRSKELWEKFHRITSYANRLRRTSAILSMNGYDTMSYELHVPMLINKSIALNVLETFSDDLAFRSLYGNYARIGGKIRQDVKILDVNKLPNDNIDMLSTMDETFRDGKVGEYIRSRFKTPSRYERSMQ